MENNKKLISRLTQQGRLKEKAGYGGDATEKFFRANVLFYCEELVNHFKGIKKEMKYLQQELEELRNKDEVQKK